MELIKSIVKRRSVRSFSKQHIERDLVREIIESTRFYPSWKNSQTARFYVVDDIEKKLAIAEKGTTPGGRNGKMIIEAPVLVVLTIKKGLSGTHPDGVYVTNKKDTWEMFDSGIAAQTFSLVAFSKGLGSVILGIFDEHKVAEICNIPEDEEVAVLIPMGYPKDDEIKDGVRKPVEEILTFI